MGGGWGRAKCLLDLMCSSGHQEGRQIVGDRVREIRRSGSKCVAWIWPRYNKVLFAYLCWTCLFKRGKGNLLKTPPLGPPLPPLWPVQGKYFCLDVNDNCDAREIPNWRKSKRLCAEIFQQLSRLLSQPAQRSSVCLSLCLSLSLSVRCSLVSLTWHIVSCYAISAQWHVLRSLSALCVSAKQQQRVEQTGRHALRLLFLLPEDTQIELRAGSAHSVECVQCTARRDARRGTPKETRRLTSVNAIACRD